MIRIIIILSALFLFTCKDASTKKTPYIGGWPYNSNKDNILDPGFGECPSANGCECDVENLCPENSECTQLFRGKYCTPKIGSYIPRFKGTDQFGDEFDLYDLANQGKPIIIEIGSASPSAVNDLSAWLSNLNDGVKESKWWKSEFEGIKDIIDNDKIFWVHFIHSDENKNPSSPQTVSSWHKKYPQKNIIIVSDPASKMKTWIRPTGMPCLILIDENMQLIVHSLRGVEDAINGTYNLLGTK